MVFLYIQKILFLYCGGTTHPIPTVDALHVYVKNMYFNKSIIFKNPKSQALATIRHLQKIDLFAKTRAECQFLDIRRRDCLIIQNHGKKKIEQSFIS